VSTKFVLEFLERTGIERTDKRLAGLVAAMDKLGGLDKDYEMTLDDFASATSSCNTLFHRIVTGNLRVPNFEGLRQVIKEVYAIVEPNRSGANATYIP